MPPIYVIRHGQTEWNAAGRLQGHRDSPLTALGRAQAAAMGAALADDGVTAATHRFHVSTSGRAQETARIALGPLGATARPDARLRELGIGALEGLTWPEIEARLPHLVPLDIWTRYGALEEGEGVAALRARLEDFLAGIDAPSVLFTHGLASRLIRGILLGLSTADCGTLPGGQGVIWRLEDGAVTALAGPGGPPLSR